jgi:hypothetical protein
MSLGVQRNGPVTTRQLLESMTLREEVRPCACGGFVVADPRMPQQGVMEHRDTARHRIFSDWFRTYRD